MTDLQGKCVLITGAARGIGRATALAFADEGARVVACDIGSLDVTRTLLAERTNDFLALTADVSDEASVKGVVAQAVKSFGTIDIAVNNAGIILEKPLTDTSVEDFQKVINVNLKGVFLVGREVIRIMQDQGVSGRLVNVASELGLLGRERFSIYCASKGAVITLTRSWAREFAPDIIVNTVAPGPVDTDMIGLDQISPEWAEKELNTLLGRVGHPHEIADAIVFLCGSKSTYITGQTIGVNGGVAMY